MAVGLGIGFTFTLLGALGVGVISSAQAAPLALPANQAPIVGVSSVLYDGSLNIGSGLPGDQEFLYISDSAAATQTFASGVTTLDTTLTQTISAGYFHNYFLAPKPTLLNQNTGFTVKFTAQVVSEDHTDSDKNGDAIGDRAGFSIIAISSDKKGIELGFWENEIWAQEGGTSPNLFTYAEGAAFDTTSALHPYELTVLGDYYSLSVSRTFILSGTVRDYTAFAPPNPLLDVYELPNFIFLGDDTSSASADIKLAYVSVITNVTPSSRTVNANTLLPINNLGVMDLDANGNDVVVTMTVTGGVLTLTATAANGLSAGDISGNGSSMLGLTGSIGEINATLAASPALTYQSISGFVGTDTLTVIINDQGHTGSGGALTGHKSFNITVTGSKVQLTKIVSPTTASPGQTITYTLNFSNAGNITATGVVITDKVPITLTNVSSTSTGATLTPIAGQTFAWLVEDLAASESGAITITGQISPNLTGASRFTNTATIATTAIDANDGSNSAATGVDVESASAGGPDTFLPIILKETG